jgi:hypothetical protein
MLQWEYKMGCYLKRVNTRKGWTNQLNASSTTTELHFVCFFLTFFFYLVNYPPELYQSSFQNSPRAVELHENGDTITYSPFGAIYLVIQATTLKLSPCES